MDIDSPPDLTLDTSPLPHHTHLNLPSFSLSFPLPFRVLFLIGLAQLLWASNLHILHLLGLDTSWILDIRDPPEDVKPPEIELDPLNGEEEAESLGLGLGTGVSKRVPSGNLYGPVYKIFAGYTAWVGLGWVLFRLITNGEAEKMERYRGVVGVIAVGAIAGVVLPYRGIGERERMALRRAIRRIFWPPVSSPVFFSDVILADILTSFAKVLGDLIISGCQLWYGGITQGRVGQKGFARYLTLTMICLPYTLRFRQCLLEFYQSSFTSPRPLANSLKYFSAFPVILLSAAQKSVVKDIAESKGITVQQLGDTGERWFGEHRLFRLWLLAVVVNSMFSFWWDVEMDWGLRLCEVDTWLGEGRGQGRIGHVRRGSLADATLVGRIKRMVRRSTSISHHRSPLPTPSPVFGDNDRLPTNPSLSPNQSNLLLSSPNPSLSPTPQPRFFAFGLRPQLLLPDPIVYHLFTAIDLVLRLTWSLKLSSHLHTISEIESGVFMMEALELLRRWMWVFVRVEWEAVKMGEIRRLGRERGGGVVWEEPKEEGEGLGLVR